MYRGVRAQTGDAVARRRRKLHALSDHLGLSRDERIELSRTVLHRDITSWSHLDPGQVDRMLDCLEGAILVDELRRQRVTLPAART